MNGFVRVLLSDAYISGIMRHFTIMRIMTRGKKHANGEVITSSNNGEEERMDRMRIVNAYNAVKGALNTADMASAILTCVSFRLIHMHYCLVFMPNIDRRLFYLRDCFNLV
jgi:hypothetical protein